VIESFDLVAVGTGSAASSAAHRCRAAGWRVAVVDSLPFGGTCALRGCDPKKVLVGAAELIDSVRRMEARGIDAGQARIDWPALMRFKQSFVEGVPRKREESFTRAGIATFHGRARFVDRTSVRIGDAVLKSRYFVVATGMGGNQTVPDYSGIPSVAFTLPPVAAVGLGEAEARRQGLRFRVHTERTSNWYSSRRVAEDYSGFKVLIEEGTERILGAHLLGPHAEDTINLFALAIRSGIPATTLKQAIFAYPTHASDVAYML
jgi:pyruvate/2-oxoglutarate dehydrogenase complex dihydrolipoamide dehydrogenase (E3) component